MSELPLPLCAVIIPCFNKASTVARAIASVKNQTLSNFECVLIDDGSTDNSREVILDAIKDDGRFRYVYQTNARVAAARNRGVFRETTAPFVCCLDADDEILGEFLEGCCQGLMRDRSMGITYTSMQVVSQEGQVTVSQWPGEYNFDLTPRGRNQVPTCNVARREAWVRAGGQRDRYCEGGAGSEDADLWLRIGMLGYGGQRVSTEPLFRYYLGGAVGGNPDYREKDWRGDKGYLTTRAYPFAATITPENGQSHLVRQYDEPLISVVIPVGPGHVATLIDAIDSIEGQTFRKWELIVVDDNVSPAPVEDQVELERLAKAFPFVTFYHLLGSPRGAGAARNLGAELARAPLLLFLDADDWLTPTALEDMFKAYEENFGSIVYADYIGHAYIEDQAVLDRLSNAKRLLEYNRKTKEATTLYASFEYDCELAQRQPVPGKDPYIWNVISSLVPKAYHREIGGFDESMQSWEDWDYWVRMAKAGKCFHHLHKPLMEYRFYTGKRRSLANPYESGENGRQLSLHLLEYMRSKYEKLENKMCKSCGGRRSSPPPLMMSISAMGLSRGGDSMANVSANDMVEVELVDGNIGDHLIAIGGRSYGYKMHGDRFPMLRSHANLDRRVRIVGKSEASTPSQLSMQESPPPPPPPDDDDDNGKGKPVPSSLQNEVALMKAMVGSGTSPKDVTITSDATFDLSELWGIDENRAVRLREIGVRTAVGVSMMTPEKIGQMFDLNPITSRRIIAEAQKFVDEQVKKEAKTNK